MVSNLETGEPLWFGRDRKQETLDEFFSTQLSGMQRERIAAACVDMWEPYTASILSWTCASGSTSCVGKGWSPSKKLAEMLLSHLDGILNCCRVPVRFGVVEAVNSWRRPRRNSWFR